MATEINQNTQAPQAQPQVAPGNQPVNDQPINEYDSLIDSEPLSEKPSKASNEYDSLIESDGIATTSSPILQEASKNDPSKYAQALKVSKELGVSARPVYENMDEFESKINKSDINIEALRADYPGTAKYLDDYDNASISHRDVEKLLRSERSSKGFNAVSNFYKGVYKLGEEVGQALETGLNSSMAQVGLMGLMYNIGDQEVAAKVVAEYTKRSNDLARKAPSYANQFKEELDKEVSFRETFDKLKSLKKSFSDGQYTTVIKDFASSGAMGAGEILDLLRVTATNSKGALYTGAESAVNSLPATIGGVGAFALGGGTISLAAMGFIGGVLPEIGGSTQEQLSSKYDLSKESEIKKMLKDPMLEEIKAGAIRKGVTTAGIDSVLGMFASGKFLHGAEKAGKIAKAAALLKETGLEMVSEATSEFAGKVAEQKGNVTVKDFESSLLEGALSPFTGALLQPVMYGISRSSELFSTDKAQVNTQIHETLVETNAAIDVVGRGNIAKDIINNLSETETVNIAPEKLDEIIVNQVGEEGAVVYFQDEDIKKFISETPGVKAEEVLAELYGNNEERKRIEELKEPIAVNLASLARLKAKGADIDTLFQSAKFDPAGSSIGESQQYFSELPNILETLVKDSYIAEEDTIIKEFKSNLESEIIATGFKAREAKAYSSLVSRFYQNYADISGKNFNQVLAENNLKVAKAEYASEGDLNQSSARYKLENGIRVDKRAGETLQTQHALPENIVVKTYNNTIGVSNTLEQTVSRQKRYTQKHGNRKITNTHTGRNFSIAPTAISELVENTSKNLTSVDNKAKKRRTAANLSRATDAALKNLDQILQDAIYVFQTGDNKHHLYTVTDISGLKVLVKFDAGTKNKINTVDNIEIGFIGKSELDRVSGTLDTDLQQVQTPTQSQASISYLKEAINKARDIFTFFQDNPDVTNLDEYGFYSQLSREVSKMDFKSIPPKDLINRINKIPGIKKDEITHTGIIEFLEGLGDEKVSKETVEEFLDNNGVKVEMVVLGEGGATIADQELDWTVEVQPISVHDSQGANDMAYERVSDDIASEPEIYKERWQRSLEEGELDGMDEDEIEKAFDSWIESNMDDFVNNEIAYLDEEEDFSQTSLATETSEGDEVSIAWAGYQEEADVQVNGRTIGEIKVSDNIEEVKIKARELLVQKGYLRELVRRQDVAFEDKGINLTGAKLKELSKEYIENYPGGREALIDIAVLNGRVDAEASDITKSIMFRGMVTEAVKEKYAKGDYGFPNRAYDIGNIAHLYQRAPKEFELSYYDIQSDNNERYKFQAENFEEAKEKALDKLELTGHIANSKEKKEATLYDPSLGTKFNRYTVKGGENYREYLFTLPNNKGKKFTYETHFKTPNYVLHVRTKDRLDSDGKKVLYIEEIQSDWHQQGREEGYVSEFKDEKPDYKLEADLKLKEGELERNFNNLNKEMINVGKELYTLEKKLGFDSSKIPLSKYTDALKEFHKKSKSKKLKALIEKDNQAKDQFLKAEKEYKDALKEWADVAHKNTRIENAKNNLIPDAPFSSTDAWATLAVKRILKMATDMGYQKVAVTPGIVHADHYGTDRFGWKKTDEGWEFGSVSQVGGTAGGIDIEGEAEARGLVIRSDKVIKTEEELSAAIADQISEDEKSRQVQSLTKSTWERMQKSPEGMREPRKEGLLFAYDYLVPKAFNNYLKKIKVDQKMGKEIFEGYESNVIEITPDIVKKVNAGQTLFQEKRGAITLDDQGAIIKIFQAKNKSTFLHESGHLFLNMYGKLYNELQGKELTPRQKVFIEDSQKIFKYLEVESYDNIKTEHHEKFAKSFEAYLAEGNAPAPELKSIFIKFGAWLRQIYSDVARALGVNLSKDIREVFDKMLIINDQFEQSEIELSKFPLFAEAHNMGMTAKEAESYEKAVQDSRESVIEQMHNETIRREKIKFAKEYKEQKQKLKTEIRKEVVLLPGYTIVELATRGKTPSGQNSPLDIPNKLNRKEVVSLIGKEAAKKLNRHKVLLNDGTNPELIGGLAGSEDVYKDLIALSNMPTIEEEVEARASQIMAERYKEQDIQSALEDIAEKEFSSQKRINILRMELKHLASKDFKQFLNIASAIAGKVPSDAIVKKHVKEKIQRLKIKEVSSKRFLRSAATMAKNAAKSLKKSDIQAAFDFKLKELYYTEMYHEAILKEENLEKYLAKFNKLKKSNEKLSKTRDTDLVNVARTLVNQFGFDIKTKETAGDLKKLVAYDPELADSLAGHLENVKQFSDYKQATVEDFEDLAYAFDALWDLSKDINEYKTANEKLKLKDVVGQLVDQLQEKNLKVKSPDGKKSITDKEKILIGLNAISAMTKRMESWADYMGDKYLKFIFNPVKEASEKYREVRTGYYEQISKMFEKVNDKVTKEKISAPEIEYTFENGYELVGALLHTGNKSNLKKLLLGRKWGTLNKDSSINSSKWDALVKRLMSEGIITKEIMDFTQETWDLLEGLKPLTQKAHKAMYGFYFKEIETSPLITPFGTYRGGYFPAKTDKNLVIESRQNADKEVFSVGNTYAVAANDKGATMTRQEGYNQPLDLDVRMFMRHVDWALRFSYIFPSIRQVQKVIRNREFAAELTRVDPKIIEAGLIPWLQRAAQQITEMPVQHLNFLSKGASFVRKSVSGQIMGLNISNWMQNFTGLFPAMASIGATHVLGATTRYLSSPKLMFNNAAVRSKFMAQRADDKLFEINGQVQDMIVNPTKIKSLREWSKKAGSFGVRYTQLIVDTIVWNAAYNKGLKNMSESEAVKFADRKVRDTQGSAYAEDISALEAANPFAKLFLMFYGYFNTQANFLTKEAKIILEESKGLETAKNLGHLYLFGLALPAVVAEIIAEAMRGGDFDDEEGDGYADEFADLFIASQLKYSTAMIPVLGQVGQSYINALNDVPYDDKISLSPVLGFLESSARIAPGVLKVLDGDASEKQKTRVIQDTMSLLGTLTGIPLLPPTKILLYNVDVLEGNIEPRDTVDYLRGTITGKPGKDR